MGLIFKDFKDKHMWLAKYIHEQPHSGGKQFLGLFRKEMGNLINFEPKKSISAINIRNIIVSLISCHLN